MSRAEALALAVPQALAVPPLPGERESEAVGQRLGVLLVQVLREAVLLPDPVAVLEAVPLRLPVVEGEREAVGEVEAVPEPPPPPAPALGESEALPVGVKEAPLAVGGLLVVAHTLAVA